MMQLEQIHVALKRADGGVSIMAFLTVGRGNVLPRGAQWLGDGWWSRPPTTENIDHEVRQHTGIVSWRHITAADVPADRSYRDAWTDNGTITHDMPIARGIHRERVRRRRREAFEQLDAEWMRAIGQNRRAEADAIEAQRQLWRDAPANPLIDTAQTVEDLKAVTLPGA
jgi:hypothetical protein